jgi:hypothetical protein
MYLLIFVRESEGHLKVQEVMNNCEKLQVSDSPYFGENKTGKAS